MIHVTLRHVTSSCADGNTPFSTVFPQKGIRSQGVFALSVIFIGKIMIFSANADTPLLFLGKYSTNVSILAKSKSLLYIYELRIQRRSLTPCRYEAGTLTEIYSLANKVFVTFMYVIFRVISVLILIIDVREEQCLF